MMLHLFSFIVITIIIMYNTGQLTLKFVELGRCNWKAFCTFHMTCLPEQDSPLSHCNRENNLVNI